MPRPRPEINHWLQEHGYSPDEIEKILGELDRFDERTNRESLFEDLASGAFDIGPLIEQALKEP